jgi:hypothetical protein
MFLFIGMNFPGTRDDLIDYMTTVGYTHIPGGHKAIEMWMDHFFLFLISPKYTVRIIEYIL